MASVYATGGDLRITNTSSNTIDRTVIVLEYTRRLKMHFIGWNK